MAGDDTKAHCDRTLPCYPPSPSFEESLQIAVSFWGARGGGPNERLEGPWPGLRPALGVGLGGYTAVVTNQEMRNDS